MFPRTVRMRTRAGQRGSRRREQETEQKAVVKASVFPVISHHAVLLLSSPPGLCRARRMLFHSLPGCPWPRSLSLPLGSLWPHPRNWSPDLSLLLHVHVGVWSTQAPLLQPQTDHTFSGRLFSESRAWVPPTETGQCPAEDLAHSRCSTADWWTGPGLGKTPFGGLHTTKAWPPRVQIQVHLCVMVLRKFLDSSHTARA